MKTRLYKLEFSSEVHFGDGVLDHSNNAIYADTLFSALCIEAVKCNQLEHLYRAFYEDHLKISDGFPYKKDSLYLPKPIMYIEKMNSSVISKESVALRKKFKNLKFIKVDLFNDYLKGNDILGENGLEEIGSQVLRTKNSIRNGTDETLPYHVGTFKFNKDYGLYFILRYDSEDAASLVDKLFKSVALCGIGGKRSEGMGRFNLKILNSEKEVLSLDTLFNINSNNDKTTKILLSVALPKEEELSESIKDAAYLLLKRSGFVTPEDNMRDLLKKKDLFAFASGACFKHSFAGDIYDVSKEMAHPVYRYAKPLFLEVNIQ